MIKHFLFFSIWAVRITKIGLDPSPINQIMMFFGKWSTRNDQTLKCWKYLLQCRALPVEARFIASPLKIYFPITLPSPAPPSWTGFPQFPDG